MRREFKSACHIIAMLSVGLAVSAAAQGETDVMPSNGAGIQLPARFIPVPLSVSSEAQAYLSRAPAMAAASTPDPKKDRAAWNAYYERTEAQLTAVLQQMAKGHPAEITGTHKLAKFVLYEVTPKSLTPRNEKRAILYLHGGAFTLGGGLAAAYGAFSPADAMKMRTFSVDYRMPPDYPFPASLDDAVEAYRWLIADRYKAKNIAIYGGSSGGNLAAALVLKVRDLGLPMPGAVVLHTPATDLLRLSDSLQTNFGIDPALGQPGKPVRGGSDPDSIYAPGQDLKNPYVSPLYGDFTKGFPPTILTTGTRDMLLSDTVRMHRALRRAGIKAELNVYEAMPHGGFFGTAPEDQEVLEEHARFLDQNLGTD